MFTPDFSFTFLFKITFYIFVNISSYYRAILRWDEGKVSIPETPVPVEFFLIFLPDFFFFLMTININDYKQEAVTVRVSHWTIQIVYFYYRNHSRFKLPLELKLLPQEVICLYSPINEH
uniref:Uncharacterized protein n=1 Tax=Cacopsylla melanoneura TaxID=428564 RepID=A0A8D9DV16_9HEMI